MLLRLSAMRSHRVSDYCRALGAQGLELSELKAGLLVTTLRRLNEVLELKPGVAGIGVNLNAVIERIIGPAARPISE